MRQTVLLTLALLSLYGLIAYMLLPILWTHYEHQRGLAGLPMVTRTAQGIPGDPINVGLIGSRDDIACAMKEAGWSPAAPIS
ncbi:MAG: LssY C-terminal domain-containing protein, partial [Rhizobiales bacterium]|nr:LssY C-terminal domain-containing protein [Hyphomicrobiales bacterium]